MTQFIDLPEDILTIIFTFLSARDFLELTRSNKDLHQYRLDPTFWRTLTSSTFRLPISPLLKADGVRWYWLYRRLKVQTQLFTWGQGVRGNLGPGVSQSRGPRRMIRGRPIGIRPANIETFQRTTSSWPTHTDVPNEINVIADLQCGGWSTSILSSAGKLYVVGIVDSKDNRQVGDATTNFTQLHYITESTSAIKQFSSGRRHILAITDDGEILSWDRINRNGLKVFSRQGRDFGGKASRVVAGWEESSAYIPETGIVYWTPLKNDSQDDNLDGLSVDAKIIPDTARVRSDGRVIEVVAHVVLESFIVWLTSDSKVYGCDIRVDNTNQVNPSHAPFEVPGYNTSGTLEDIQGQYNKYAVFSSNGEILAGDADYLRRCAAASLEADPDLTQLATIRPRDVPALQHQEVIQLAFGDHHYHALHANGTITAYGTESEECGALGLGGQPTGARFRGLLKAQNPRAFRPDARLIPQAELKGREVWFEPEKRDWLTYLEQNSNVAGDHNQIWRTEDNNFQFSEWVEQEGRHWNEGPVGWVPDANDGSNKDTATAATTTPIPDDFHLDPYFAITVAAAGWHSSALVLVDEGKADAVRQKWITTTKHQQDENDDDEHKVPGTMPGHFESGPTDPEEVYRWKLEGFPKVQLPNGTVVPGHGEVRPWRG